MNVDPPGSIGATAGARISHEGSGTLVVTATNEDGLQETIPVPANTTVDWAPPAGWRTVTFSASGQDPEYRIVDPSFVTTMVRSLAASIPKWNYLGVAASLASAFATQSPPPML